MGLEGGLRLIDAGADATAAGGSQPKGVVTTALDAANAAEAAGHANELMWLPSLMSTQLQDARPPADEEARLAVAMLPAKAVVPKPSSAAGACP